MTKHTAKALSAESGAPSERTETQGDLWKEIAEEGYDSLDGAWETLAQRRKALQHRQRRLSRTGRRWTN